MKRDDSYSDGFGGGPPARRAAAHPLFGGARGGSATTAALALLAGLLACLWVYNLVHQVRLRCPPLPRACSKRRLTARASVGALLLRGSWPLPHPPTPPGRTHRAARDRRERPAAALQLLRDGAGAG
jgi:hypothetical protein